MFHNILRRLHAQLSPVRIHGAPGNSVSPLADILFNFTNTTRFAFPDFGYEDASFDIVSSTAAEYTPRHLQFDARYQF
jgi:hypothetical protein